MNKIMKLKKEIVNQVCYMFEIGDYRVKYAYPCSFLEICFKSKRLKNLISFFDRLVKICKGTDEKEVCVKKYKMSRNSVICVISNFRDEHK